MVMISAAKMLIFSGVMITLAGAAIGTAIVFASYILAVAKNPEESESLFNTTLMAFALIETFVFIALLIAGMVYVFL